MYILVARGLLLNVVLVYYECKTNNRQVPSGTTVICIRIYSSTDILQQMRDRYSVQVNVMVMGPRRYGLKEENKLSRYSANSGRSARIHKRALFLRDL